MTDHNARRAALLRLLEDFEAGRLTEPYVMPAMAPLFRERLTAEDYSGRLTLTPRGLAAARAEKEKQNG